MHRGVEGGVRYIDRKPDIQDVTEMLPMTYVEEVKRLFRYCPTATVVHKH